MGAQVRQAELRQRRTRKKKVGKLRKIYKKASAEERRRIEAKLQRIAFSTPLNKLLESTTTN